MVRASIPTCWAYFKVNGVRGGYQASGDTLTKAVIWNYGGGSGGVNPNIFGVTVTGTPSALPSIYNSGYTVFHSGA